MHIKLSASEIQTAIRNYIKNNHGIEIKDLPTETFIVELNDPEPKAFWINDGSESEIYCDILIHETEWGKLN